MEMKKKGNEKAVQELIEAFLALENPDEAKRFLTDLCTPQELSALAERWRVCRMLHNNELSYREIHDQTGASLATITRVARFLKMEPHQGYSAVIQKIDKKSCVNDS